MMRIFGREPALVLGAVSAALSLLVALNIGLTSVQAALWIAAITAVFGVVKAMLTRPVAPAAFTTAVVAVTDLLAGYHWALSPGLIAAVNGLVLAVLTLLTRAQVSPVSGPVVRDAA
jgi:uncharacterized membrane protein HdeD (DUF308 family)